MILHDKEIRKLIAKGLVSGYLSLEKQLQPNGFDLTAHEIFKFKGAGSIDFSNEERKFPETEPIRFAGGWAHLGQGIYKVKTNETVNIPRNIIALAQPRSSLLRMGAFTVHGIWDAGFSGRSEFALVVQNPAGLNIKQNARIAQLAFVRLPAETEKGYSGIYQNLG